MNWFYNIVAFFALLASAGWLFLYVVTLDFMHLCYSLTFFAVTLCAKLMTVDGTD